MTVGNSFEMATKFNDVRLKDSPRDSGEAEDAPFVPQNYSRTILGPISSFGLPRLYKEVRITLENCLIPEERLQNSPSLSDGLDVEIERDLRVLGCELIQSSSILLKLPQVAAATAQILYQRFFYCKSFVRYNFEYVAMACIYLASKIEEAPRRLRDVLNVFHHLKQLRQSRPVKPMLLDQHYQNLKSEVIKAERRVLKELGFCVHVKHPHKLITTYMAVLGLQEDKQLAQIAWNYMNDGLRTDVFLRYTPETIACACIYLAARIRKIVLPAGWWELFDATETQLEEISMTLLQMYKRKRPSWSKLESHIGYLRHKMVEAQKEKADGVSAGAATPMQGNAGDAGRFSPASASKHGAGGAVGGGGAAALAKNRKRRSGRSPSPPAAAAAAKPHRSRSPPSGALVKKPRRDSMENRLKDNKRHHHRHRRRRSSSGSHSSQHRKHRKRSRSIERSSSRERKSRREREIREELIRRQEMRLRSYKH